MSKQQNRLSRSLKTSDAVFVGLGSMIGAGIFTALAPAASAAQSGLIFGLAIAALVAFFNASSSAQLARLYPASGGTYVYAKERLNDFWAWLAGWGFIFGKLASCAAVALTFGYYLSPDYARYLAAVAVITFIIINYLGVKKPANATKIIVSIVLVSLLAIVVLVLNGDSSFSNLQPLFGQSGLYGILQSAGIWFFAFAGYARIATLGEEVKNPEKSIPRAILLALGLTLLIYSSVVLSALLLVGPSTLAQSNAPLVTAVEQAGFDGWQWLIRFGSTFATLGVLLSLMAGVSRTMFAMASDEKLPNYLSSVHKTNKTPHLAEITVGIIITAVVLVADIRAAIGFSAFTVLLYYAIANMSAYTLKPNERLFSKSLAVLGLAGCLVLAFTLPIQSVLAGGSVMLLGAAIYAFNSKR